ncbi:unnamed protein product [Medioppia subpectinata]|uniref:RBR-type E3 ubiquitin transferase n=1 Tax=Medioppia subpectinata TaxID=1979941 RepID=A0A7R9KAW7_9ACAR|nr:unnamed protein product [Medioppia subpectinata]CAG2100089.1 unnamed protein product [Medioppia subpectinata]
MSHRSVHSSSTSSPDSSFEELSEAKTPTSEGGGDNEDDYPETSSFEEVSEPKTPTSVTHSSFELVDKLDAIDIQSVSETKELAERVDWIKLGSKSSTGSTLTSDHSYDSQLSNDGQNKWTTHSAQANTPYIVMARDDMIVDVSAFIAQIQEVVCLPFNRTWNLLNEYNWEKQKLLNNFYDENHNLHHRLTQMVINGPQVGDDYCLECNEVMEKIDDGFGLDCGHHYCIRCWILYLSSKIASAVNLKQISCAHDFCDQLLDYNQVLDLLVDQSLKDKFVQLIVNAFVNSNPLYRFCGNTSCARIIRVVTPGSYPIRCLCLTELCFRCGQPNHYPIRCHLMDEWALRLHSDAKDKFPAIKRLVFMYFSRNTPQFEIFKENFGRFEISVDNLFEAIAKESQTLLSCKCNAEKWMNSLIGHINDGNNSEYWEYDMEDFVAL